MKIHVYVKILCNKLKTCYRDTRPCLFKLTLPGGSSVKLKKTEQFVWSEGNCSSFLIAPSMVKDSFTAMMQLE